MRQERKYCSYRYGTAFGSLILFGNNGGFIEAIITWTLRPCVNMLRNKYSNTLGQMPSRNESDRMCRKHSSTNTDGDV